MAEALVAAGGKIGTAEENSWRLRIDAPRWAVARDGHERGLARLLYFAALVWAVLGVALAWHLYDRLASNPGLVPPLSEQIGLWAAVLVVIGGAVAAGITRPVRKAPRQIDRDSRRAANPSRSDGGRGRRGGGHTGHAKPWRQSQRRGHERFDFRIEATS